MEQLRNEKEAAKRLNVSLSFLRKDRIKERLVPFVRVGDKTVRYRDSDLDAFILGLPLAVPAPIAIGKRRGRRTNAEKAAAGAARQAAIGKGGS